MSDDTFARSVVLEKALELFKDSPTVVSPDQVLEAAEKFRKFLAGETLGVAYKPAWVYFRYMNSKTIYYRADINKDDADPDAVERRGHPDSPWRKVDGAGNPKTRKELRSRGNEYKFVPATAVPAAYR